MLKKTAFDFIDINDQTVKMNSDFVIVPNIFYRTNKLYFRHSVNLCIPDSSEKPNFRLNYGIYNIIHGVPKSVKNMNFGNEPKKELLVEKNLNDYLINNIDETIHLFAELEIFYESKFLKRLNKTLSITQKVTESRHSEEEVKHYTITSNHKKIIHPIFTLIQYGHNNYKYGISTKNAILKTHSIKIIKEILKQDYLSLISSSK